MSKKIDWVFTAEYADRTHIRVGAHKKKRRGNPLDIIAVDIKSATDRFRFNIRLDESVVLAAGLNKVAAQILVGQRSGLKEYAASL